LWDKLQHGSTAHDDLADWIAAFQNPGDGKQAVERWRQTGSGAWLVAALRRTNSKDAAAQELIAAAGKLSPQSPAYATATTLALQLEVDRGAANSTRKWIDEALASKQTDDTHNALLALRFLTASDWSEFLRYAPRKPVAVAVERRDEPLETSLQGGPELDTDSVRPWNDYVPLARWVDAAISPLLPRNLQIQAAQSGWVRAVILKRAPEARGLATRLAELRPDLADSLHRYLAESDPAAAHFAAVFLMLRNPGFDYRLRAGFPRETKIDAIDDFRDNWWRPRLPAEPGLPNPPKQFLSAEERATGQKETESLLAAADIAPSYLSAQTLEWARSHPNDERVPEALHLAVRATRFGNGFPQTTHFSKAAFQLLHSQYPKSKWAAITKYWY